MGSSDESRKLHLQRAVASGDGNLADFVAGSHMQAIENVVTGGSGLSFCTQLFRTVTVEQMQEGRNSTIGLWPVSYPQIVTLPQQAAAGNLFLMQQSVNAANLWRDNSNPLPQKPAEGFPIPFHVMSRQSSPPVLNSNKTEVANGGVSVPLLPPVTPDRVSTRRNDSNQSYELPSSSVKGSAGVGQHEQFEFNPSLGPNVPIDQSVCEHFSLPEPLGPSATIWNLSNPFIESQSLEKESLHSVKLGTPSKESQNHSKENQQAVQPLTPLKQGNTLQKEDHQEMNLNETPPQKPPRRKKHRPKVITESTPKKTPQPVTPEQTCKKRRERSKRDAIPLTNIGVEEADSRKRARSCRRALNFTLEAHLGDADGRPAEAMCSELQFNGDSQNQGQVTCDSSASLKSSACGTHGLDVEVENSKTGIAFDIYHSLNQMQGEYIALPKNSENQFASNNSMPIEKNKLNSSYSSPIATRTRHKEKIKVLARRKIIPSQAQEAEHCIIVSSYSATHTPEWNTLSTTHINPKKSFVTEEPHATQSGNRTKCESYKNSVGHSTSLLEPHALFVNNDSKIIQDNSVPDLHNKKTTLSHVASSDCLLGFEICLVW